MVENNICSHCMRAGAEDYCAICGKPVCSSCSETGVKCRRW